MARLARDGFDSDGNPTTTADGDPFSVIVYPFRPTNTSSSDDDAGTYDEISGRYTVLVNDWSVDVQRGDVLHIDNGITVTITGIPFPWENPLTGSRPGRMFEGQVKQ